MHEPIARLRRIAAAARCRGSDDDVWLADRLNAYFEEARFGATLDGIFGVEAVAFAAPWWEREALDARTALIHEMARQFFPTKSPSGQSKAIARAAVEYEAACWPRDRGRTEPPDHHRGTIRELLFRAHRLGTRWPLGWRQVLRCLPSPGVPMANTSGLSQSHAHADQG